MRLIADFHIHSHYSRATSKAMTIENLYRWGKIKGINVLGTGDFTHPAWFAELREKLVPVNNGLFKLKEELAREQDTLIPQSCRKNSFKFVLTAEISNIYSKNGRVRKLHNLIIVPSFEVAAKINSELARIGNLKADGRPILGMDSKDLLKIVLDSDPYSLFIPAHIWTPWFSLFGSRSGFDSIPEAFEELAPHIKAIETGLSSDPFMNWRLDALRKVTITSNSDAHSPQRLAREANILNCRSDYKEIIGAISSNDKRFTGTIEFYPEEGKYHYDGHRLCKIRFNPSETKKRNGICPKCGKPLVVGVINRVDELADHPASKNSNKSKTVEYIIPLIEILAELKGVKGVNTKTVVGEYEKVVSKFGSEFDILRTIPISDIKTLGQPVLAEAIRRLRGGEVSIEPGYDGVYGIIKVFKQNKSSIFEGGQTSLF